MRGGDARGASLKPHDLFNDRDDFNRIENFLNATRVASVVHSKIIMKFVFTHKHGI